MFIQKRMRPRARSSHWRGRRTVVVEEILEGQRASGECEEQQTEQSPVGLCHDLETRISRGCHIYSYNRFPCTLHTAVYVVRSPRIVIYPAVHGTDVIVRGVERHRSHFKRTITPTPRRKTCNDTCALRRCASSPCAIVVSSFRTKRYRCENPFLRGARTCLLLFFLGWPYSACSPRTSSDHLLNFLYAGLI